MVFGDLCRRVGLPDRVPVQQHAVAQDPESGGSSLHAQRHAEGSPQVRVLPSHVTNCFVVEGGKGAVLQGGRGVGDVREFMGGSCGWCGPCTTTC